MGPCCASFCREGPIPKIKESSPPSYAFFLGGGGKSVLFALSGCKLCKPRATAEAIYRIKSEKNKQKTHKHFSDGPRGTIVPGTTGQNGDFTVELNEKGQFFVPRTGLILSRGGVPFVPPMVPVCPRHRPAENIYVYWFFSCPAE